MPPGKKNTRRRSAANKRPSGEKKTPPVEVAGAADEAAKSKSPDAEAGNPKPSFDPSDVLKGFAKTTSRVVRQAASILEEEIAAGIVAAKQVEERFVNVSKLRSQNPDVVMQRFRRDAHEVVDIFIDLINAGSKSIGDLAGRAISIRTGSGPAKAERMAAGQVPQLVIPQPVKGGAAADVLMSVENDSDTRTAEFSFYSSDLVSSAGERIASRNVQFEPGSLTLAPHHSAKVKIVVRVPAAAAAGVYAGLLQATNLNQLRAVLSVTVV